MQTKKTCQTITKGKFETGFLHEKRVATFLNVSLGFLRKCRADGTGPRFVKFGSAVRYPVTDLEEYVREASQSFTGQSNT